MPQEATPAAGVPKGATSLEDSSRPDPTRITQLLHSWSGGDQRALDRLVPLVYEELRRLARHHMRGERDAHTLQGTGLVHEAFLRLAQQRAVHWVSRGQFYGWVSQLMRRILVDHARGHNAQKRGQGQQVLSLEQLQEEAGDAVQPPGNDAMLEILKLDRALDRMAELDPRQGQVVELRFFGGLSVEETAEALDISPATVKREWSTARAWLLQQMGEPLPSTP